MSEVYLSTGVSQKKKSNINRYNWYLEKEKISELVMKGVTTSRLAKIYGIDFHTMRKVLIHFGFSELSYEDSIEYMMDKFINKGCEFPATDRYLRSVLSIDPLFDMFDNSLSNLIHRDDYIRLFYESQENSGIEDRWKFDLSSIPEVISNKRDRFKINVCIYKSPVTGKEIWYEKVLHWEIIKKRSDILSCKQIDPEDVAAFNEKKIEQFGDKFGRENFEFSIPPNKLGIIHVKCKKCGKEFDRHFNCLCNDHKLCCPRCSDQKYGDKLTNEEFIERATKAYGLGRFGYDRVNYINKNTKVEILDLDTNEYFWVTPHVFLQGTCKGSLGRPSGERHVAQWLISAGFKEEVDFFHNYYPRELKSCKKSGTIFVDFVLTYNNKVYWIEYNGDQHYKWSNIHKTYEDFLMQVKRDQLEKSYCEENGIILISIPYTYHTYSSISKILLEIIINGQPLDIINQVEVKL